MKQPHPSDAATIAVLAARGLNAGIGLKTHPNKFWQGEQWAMHAGFEPYFVLLKDVDVANDEWLQGTLVPATAAILREMLKLAGDEIVQFATPSLLTKRYTVGHNAEADNVIVQALLWKADDRDAIDGSLNVLAFSLRNSRDRTQPIQLHV